MIPALLAAGVALSASSLITALGVVFSRRVIGSHPHGHVKVLALNSHEVVLPATAKTRHPGTFGLWTPTHHVLVGDVLREGPGRSVTREVLGQTAIEHGATVWEGDVFHSPSQLAPHEDIVIEGDAGPLPAWKIGPDSGRWVIHIHGLRATRINALRSVPAALNLGYTSLVVSYRGDGEGPTEPHQASALGLVEWHDVDAAITYAVTHGATSIVLVGWSMGATAAMLTLERSTHRDLIVGSALISPALEWRQTMTAGARKLHLPAAALCSTLAAHFLSNPRLSRIVGAPVPIDFDALDWTRAPRITVPTLLIHSPGDRTVPYAVSQQVQAANPDTVALIGPPSPADHAWEYNVAPEAFTEMLRNWLAGLPV